MKVINGWMNIDDIDGLRDMDVDGCKEMDGQKVEWK